MVAGLAVYDTISRCLLPNTPLVLKWPNDLMVYEAKIAGILLERQGNSVVAGFGVNVSWSPEIPDRETTHIVYANGKFANDAESVLDLLAPAFAQRLEEWRSAGPHNTLLEWAIRSHRYGDMIRVTGNDGGIRNAHYHGIDSEGGLRFQAIGEQESVLRAGDVILGWHDKEEG